MQIEYLGVIYNEGDIISFNRKLGRSRNSSVREVQGVLRFGLYNDSEQYEVFEHLGFYVEIEGESSETLPDAIAQNGKIIK